MQELFKLSPDNIPLIKKASITAAEAFMDDPSTLYSIPDEGKRANLHYAFEYYIRTSIARGAEVYLTSANCEGVAIWFYSEARSPYGLLSRIGNPLLPLRCGWRFILGSMYEYRLTDRIKKLYAPRPYEYLALLAVNPVNQKKGYASALLNPMLKKADEQRLPCYLETQNMKNVKMYNYFGFEVVYETSMPKSNLPEFMMLRRQVSSFKPVHDRIWELAFPYQDKRNDTGHAEVTLHFARILQALEKGDEDVIVPAIMLHDIGWSQVPDRMLVFDRNASKEDRKRVVTSHQQYSVELARPILEKVGYSPALIEEILEIISQHDTRKGFISKNDGLVRDADKLWRVSKRGVAAAINRGKKDIKEPFRFPGHGGNRKGYYYSESAKRIDSKEIEDRKRETGSNEQ
jgi:HD superfamily phosphodiesterase